MNLALDDLEPLIQSVLETLVTKEVEVRDRDGRWHLLRVRPYRTTDNRIDGVVLLMLDIDEMKRSQDALQQARDLSQAVVEAVQVPLAVLDGELRVQTANAAFRTLSGAENADLERCSFPDLVETLWHWPDLRGPLQQIVQDGASGTLHLDIETATSPVRSLRLAARAVQTGGERAVVIVMEDITAQRHAEHLLETDRQRLAGQVRSTAEVLEQTRDELHALAGGLFTSQEEERRRVARELHDDISQKLAILEIDTDRLAQRQTGGSAELGTILDQLRKRIGALADDVRNVSHQLHPSALDHLGLAAALKGLIEEFGEREGMVATFRQNGVPEDLPPVVAVSLYRIAQEALRNVGKHAGRTHVKIALEGTGQELRLEIRDFGEGFDLDGQINRGLGLVSMEERARLIGGRLAVQSALGEGTTVVVTVRLSGESKD